MLTQLRRLVDWSDLPDGYGEHGELLPQPRLIGWTEVAWIIAIALVIVIAFAV